MGTPSQPHVMIVDDNPANLRIVEDVLRQRGYKVSSILWAKLARAVAMRNRSDLLLLILGKPEMNGYGVCEHLKSTKQLSDIPITALDEAEDKLKAFWSGAVEVETQLQLQALWLTLKQQNLGDALETIREEERRELARTIHDELGQALSFIKIELSRLNQDLPAYRADLIEASQSVLKLVDRAIGSVRQMATDLRPKILDDLGLIAAVKWAAEEFEDRTKTKCQVSIPESGLEVDPAHATALFRIFQETLTNIMRHANATQVDVFLAKDDGHLILEVQDNGRGIRQQELYAGGSLGVLGMRERTLLLGGEFSIHGIAGKGTTIRVRIPATIDAIAQEGIE